MKIVSKTTVKQKKKKPSFLILLNYFLQVLYPTRK